MLSEALQTWSDPATGLKYTHSGNGSWQCVASPRPSGPSINTNLMVRDTTGQLKASKGPLIQSLLLDSQSAKDWLPIGGHAWNSAADEFAQWAEENSCPVRTAKSLKAKFKQFVRTSKPTGDAECPPHIECAHFIEDQINEKAGTWELDDADIVDAYEDPIEISDDEEEEETVPPRTPAITQPVCNTNRTATPAIQVKKEPNGPVVTWVGGSDDDNNINPRARLQDATPSPGTRVVTFDPSPSPVQPSARSLLSTPLPDLVEMYHSLKKIPLSSLEVNFKGDTQPSK
ncbi:uncharacterized protein LACBIDRAFT_327577 [Laccaria bicolor S238N-H82]|uniref:Predicted protein n=1 Tax=Laccaria bicolor (strain S238N-H82 / ATCC MYA-4686) TaxID=486041 RepID=B0DC62_LACBS|nr:uncharacterized protein LACBIDRAFT_327577 [Laccaria bicolor S238N-H82]EDR07680.1 predicted protein [Laccaria bicolor S238N-H82]|eukprot:XP_001881469.1 predicted protein [Laccaria bicolor S238N-H82]